MKNVIVAGVAAFALLGCSNKEEAVVVEEAPAVEAEATVEEVPAETAVEVTPEATAEVVPAEVAK